jgi:ribosomal protein L40E
MVCAKCGTKNTRSAKYCGKCGHPFLRVAERGRPPGAASSVGKAADLMQGRTISFDFRAADFGDPNGGAITFGEPPRRERSSRLRESYISLLEKSLPEALGVFKPGEAEAEEQAPHGWADVAAPPSTPWALEQEYQTAGARQAEEDFARESEDARTAEEADRGGGRIVGWLVTFSRRAEGEDFRVRAGRAVIGTHPKCDIVLDDAEVSGVHASIAYEGGRCYIKDELSRHGTFVNEAAVEGARPLESYDEIRVGQTTFKFISVERQAAPRARAQAAD